MGLGSLGEFGKAFQIKVLYSLLNDKPFLQNLSDILSEDYFDSAAHKWIVGYTLKYFTQYHACPTIEVLAVEVKKIKNNDVLKISIKEELKQVYTGTIEDIEYVKEEFLNFVRNQKMKEAILKSVDLMEQGSFEEIRKVVDTALKAGQGREVVHEYENDVYTRYHEDARNPVGLPWATLEERTQGGPGGGDLMCIVSNPKGGKSWACIAIAGEAAKKGIDVMHYSLELSEAYTGKRYDAYFTGIDVDQLDTNLDAITDKVKELKGKIRIKKFPPAKTTLLNIESHLRRMKNQEGFVPGLIIIDYLEKLGNSRIRKDKNEDASDVFTEAKGLAELLNVPIVSPAQANRTAEGVLVIKGSHLAGTYEKFMIADIIVTVSKKSNIWYIMGNRYGDDDVAFKSTFNRKNGHIVIDKEEYNEEDEAEHVEEVKASVRQKFRKLED
jgi:replicative DNA helicase